ncbi:LysR family transcriptional regulator [Mycolicibacterium brisbanense]|uniref:LysR family transcriptional regulator n=1 Tax=Mycolicibacterium brisbanense TaxID=146020 RepID=A0A100W067_9MYCO|nr:LysR family transcriptional regulator [Mycolicibacterium brisbanense]MCV7161712.1 LysR family transcriptional regulator [Mycolicibacterium brisbanense]GAS89218.1 LysR family transcriptional regulator [Mycolicibacterium brisbanense]
MTNQLSARMPELSALEIFLAVATTGSLGAAGRACGLTQQAVSSRISSLEAQTGVVLVSRTPRGSTLTPSGAVVAEWAARLLDSAQHFDAGLATLRSEKRRRITVAASLTVAEHLMPRWLVALQADAARRGVLPPEFILTATNSDHAISAVRDGTADLGFVETPHVPSNVRSRIVGHDELVVIVPPDHKWTRRRSPLSADELARTPLVTRESGSGTRDALAAALQAALGAAVDQPAPILEVSSSAAVRAAVAAGAGPAVMSRLAVADDLTVGRVREVAVAGLDLRRDLRAIWVGGRMPPAGAARDLLTHITRGAVG